jgi:hypothetical protein
MEKLTIADILKEENVGNIYLGSNGKEYEILKRGEGDGAIVLGRNGGYCLVTPSIIGLTFTEVLGNDWVQKEDFEDGYYFYIDMDGIVENRQFETVDRFDEIMVDTANVFYTKEKAEEINFKQTLFRKLQRFADEYNECKIDWNDFSQRKYTIYYNCITKEFLIDNKRQYHHFGQVYFSSEEICQKAIDVFKEDLLKYYERM